MVDVDESGTTLGRLLLRLELALDIPFTLPSTRIAVFDRLFVLICNRSRSRLSL